MLLVDDLYQFNLINRKNDNSKLFKCKEYSGCCMRNCCPASSRGFNMVIKHIANTTNLDENFSSPFVYVKKPFKCLLLS